MKLNKNEFTHEAYLEMRNSLQDLEMIKDFGDYYDITPIPPPTYEENLQLLRARRECECFPIINRGQLWYDSLNAEQITELKEWYQKWLNVTETNVAPTKPDWLK